MPTSPDPAGCTPWIGIADLRRALRSLVAHPQVTLVATLSVGVGLGVNLALFGILYGFYVQERPVPAADRLLWVAFVEEGGEGPVVVSPPLSFLPLLAEAPSIETVGGRESHRRRVLMGGTTLYRTWVSSTTPGFHELQGYSPTVGRFFTSADTMAGAAPVAVIAFDRAVSMFGSPSAALDETVELDGVDYLVVGVLPASYDSGDFPIRVPLGGGGRSADRDHGEERVRTVVRLREGVSAERVRAEIETLAARFAESRGSPAPRVRTGGEKEVLVTGAAGEGVPPLLLALAVLLVAAANLATVLLSRGLARRRVIALRRLLGASRWDLLRPLVLESLVIAAGAGAVGILLAWIGFRTGLGFPGADAPRLSAPLLLFGTGLMGLVVLVGGCWPAFVSGRVEAAELIRSGGSSVTGPGRGLGRTMGLVLAVQVAVALPVVLFTGSAVADAIDDRRRGVGFDPVGLIHVELPSSALGDIDPHRILESAEAEPSIARIAATSTLPVGDPARVEVERGTPRFPTGPPPNALRVVRTVGDPLDVLRVPLLRGRRLTSGDARAGAPVAVVSSAAGEALFGAGEVLGRRVRFRGSSGEDNGPWLTVVGIVGEVRDQPLFQDAPPPAVWTSAPLPGRATTTVWARPGGPDLAPGRRALARVVSDVVGAGAPTIEGTEGWVRRQTAASRFAASASGAAASLAILLCLVGLYGLTALVGVQRKAELGVRAALGADRWRLVRTILGHVLGPVTIGVVGGAVLWAGVETVVLSGDAVHGGVVGAALLFTALVAATSLRPALRAGSKNPAEVLYSE